MLKIIAAATVAAVLLHGAAQAQVCGAYPYTLTNGNTADASQVMANFNQIINCGNSLLAPRASPVFTGNVGIGINNPSAKMDIQVSGGIGVGAPWSSSWLRIGEPNALGQNSSGIGLGYDTTNETGYLIAIAPGVSWRPMGVEGAPLVINTHSGSNVGIGTATPSSTLFVNGTAGGTSAYTVTSDLRLKAGVETLTGALGLVQRLRGVRYTWRRAEERTVGQELRLPMGEPQIGFIAQEVEAVVPEAVSTPRVGSNGIYGLRPEGLIPILVEAMKQQQSQIDQLQRDVELLRADRSHGKNTADLDTTKTSDAAMLQVHATLPH